MGRYPKINEESCGVVSSNSSYVSRLEIPSGKDPRQNAWLTITLDYSLNFVDRNNPAKHSNGEPIILGNRTEGYFMAVDSDKNRFRAMDWDSYSKQIFHEKFKKSESFWNHKFLLETPADYAGLDFKGSDGCMYRPNILCLFRLREHKGLASHKRINVVRADVTQIDFRSNKAEDTKIDFRSDVNVYNHTDVDNSVVWHELGNALSQLHIQNLAKTPIGQTLCVKDVNNKACYITPPEYGPANVMGTGSALHPVNAKPWLEQIECNTGIPSSKWIARMSTNIPPRVIRRA